MIAFHLPIVPPKATSQGAGKRIVIKNGRPMFFKNDKATGSENDLTLLCSQHQPSVPLTGPIKLQVDFVFPWRKSESKWRRNLGRVPMDARPDCDNLVKMIADVLTKLSFYEDDGQVTSLEVSKAWGDRVGISVALTPIDLTPRQ